MSFVSAVCVELKLQLWAHTSLFLGSMGCRVQATLRAVLESLLLLQSCLPRLPLHPGTDHREAQLEGPTPQIPGSALTARSTEGPWLGWAPLTALPSPAVPGRAMAISKSHLSRFSSRLVSPMAQLSSPSPGRWFVLGSAWCWGQARPCNKCSESLK